MDGVDRVDRQRRRGVYRVECRRCGDRRERMANWPPNISAGCAVCGGKLFRWLLDSVTGEPGGYGPRRAKELKSSKGEGLKRAEGWGQYSPMGHWHFWRWSRLDFGRWLALCGQTAPRCAFGDRPTLLYPRPNGRPVCRECRQKSRDESGMSRMGQIVTEGVIPGMMREAGGRSGQEVRGEEGDGVVMRSGLLRECPECGEDMEWTECYALDCEDGYHHDCGEDTCCCADPTPNEPCETCHGEGGWFICPSCTARRRVGETEIE